MNKLLNLAKRLEERSEVIHGVYSSSLRKPTNAEPLLKDALVEKQAASCLREVEELLREIRQAIHEGEPTDIQTKITEFLAESG